MASRRGFAGTGPRRRRRVDLLRQGVGVVGVGCADGAEGVPGSVDIRLEARAGSPQQLAGMQPLLASDARVVAPACGLRCIRRREALASAEIAAITADSAELNPGNDHGTDDPAR